MTDSGPSITDTPNTNISTGKKKMLTWIFLVIYIITLYSIKRPKLPGQSSYQAWEQIWQIIWWAFVSFTIWYVLFWLFTFKIKDKSSAHFLFFWSLWFIVWLFLMINSTK